MTILIGKMEDPGLDYSKFLIDSSEEQINQESERRAFERVVDDARFRFSDFEGTFTALFGSGPSQARWRVAVITDTGRTVFLGEIYNPSIVFDIPGEFVTIDVYSLDRIFWDRAAQLLLTLPHGTVGGSTIDEFLPVLYTNVLFVLEHECAPERFDYVFTGLDIDARYRFRPIRGWAHFVPPGRHTIVNIDATANTLECDSDHHLSVGDGIIINGTDCSPSANGSWYVSGVPSPSSFQIPLDITGDGSTGTVESSLNYIDPNNKNVGDIGRYRELDSSTTVKELLQAFAIYYNAEFFINPENGKLTMRKRNTPVKATQTPIDIDELVQDDETLEIELADDQRIDYIKTVLQTPKPDAPIPLQNILDSHGLFGIFSWRLTFVAQYASYVLESDAGAETTPIRLGHAAGGEIVSVGFELLRIPVSNRERLASRRLYRQQWTGEFDPGGAYLGPGQPKTGYYLVAEIPGNNTQGTKHTITDINAASDEITTADDHGFQTGQLVAIDGTGTLDHLDGKAWKVSATPTSKKFKIGISLTANGSTGQVWGNVDFVDRNTHTGTIMIPRDRGIIPTYLRYDEDSGTWLDPIFADGTIPEPAGEIFDVTPTLRFSNVHATGSILQYSLIDLISFFGGLKDFDLGIFQEQWKEMFMVKRRLRATCNSLDFRLGDPLKSSGRHLSTRLLKGGNLVVKKASMKLLLESTALEAIEL